MTASFDPECGPGSGLGYSGGQHVHDEYLTSADGALLYSLLGHTHVGDFAPTVHTHAYSPIGHAHDYLTGDAADLMYSALGHTHAPGAHSHAEYLTPAAADLIYSNLAHTHPGSGHNHDADYAPITHFHDHGGLGGLTDDDHTHYALVTGARAFTGNVLVQKNQNAVTTTEVRNTTSGSQAGASLLAQSAASVAVSLSAYDASNTFFPEYAGKGVVDAGVNTAGLVLTAAKSTGTFEVKVGGRANTDVALYHDGTDFGINTKFPQGPLHLYTPDGGFGFFVKKTVGAAVQVILPVGSLAVAEYMMLLGGVITTSTGNTVPLNAGFCNVLAIGPGGEITITPDADVWKLRVNADGSVDIRRTTAGAATADINLFLVWM